jgi:predicted chitinase
MTEIAIKPQKKANEIYRKVYTENEPATEHGDYMTSLGNLELNEDGWKYPGGGRGKRIGDPGPEWWLQKLGEEA